MASRTNPPTSEEKDASERHQANKNKAYEEAIQEINANYERLFEDVHTEGREAHLAIVQHGINDISQLIEETRATELKSEKACLQLAQLKIGLLRTIETCEMEIAALERDPSKRAWVSAWKRERDSAWRQVERVDEQRRIVVRKMFDRLDKGRRREREILIRCGEKRRVVTDLIGARLRLLADVKQAALRKAAGQYL